MVAVHLASNRWRFRVCLHADIHGAGTGRTAPGKMCSRAERLTAEEGESKPRQQKGRAWDAGDYAKPPWTGVSGPARDRRLQRGVPIATHWKRRKPPTIGKAERRVGSGLGRPWNVIDDRLDSYTGTYTLTKKK